MFSASCSPVKMSGSKQINAIFITIYISGTAISFEKVASPGTQRGFASPGNMGTHGGFPQVTVHLVYPANKPNLLLGKCIIARKLILVPPGNGVLSPFPTSFLHPLLDF